MIEFILGMAVGVIVVKKLKKFTDKIKLPKIPPFQRVVKFSDGTYGVRRGYAGIYQFKSFLTSTWWGAGYGSFKNCKTEDKRIAEEACGNNGHGEPV